MKPIWRWQLLRWFLVPGTSSSSLAHVVLSRVLFFLSGILTNICNAIMQLPSPSFYATTFLACNLCKPVFFRPLFWFQGTSFPFMFSFSFSFLDFSYFLLILEKKNQNSIVLGVLTAATNWVLTKSCIDKNWKLED